VPERVEVKARLLPSGEMLGSASQCVETTTGTGASQTWTSESGDGELTLTKSDAKTGIAYDMAFIMGETRAPAACAMTYDAADGTTTVIWTMEGDVGDFMPPVIAGFMTPLMKGEIGSMFDKGLVKLKTIVETPREAEGEQ